MDGLGGVLFQYPFRVPAYYALILRSLTVLEGLVSCACTAASRSLHARAHPTSRPHVCGVLCLAVAGEPGPVFVCVVGVRLHAGGRTKSVRAARTPRRPPPPTPTTQPLLPLHSLLSQALTADPNYKLIAAAYPYMARRLLTDPAPELR